MSLHIRSLICTFSFLFLLYVNPLSAGEDVCRVDNYYLIMNKKSGMVLEATSNVVLLQHVNGKPAQLWSFHCASKPGLFLIVNKETGDVLDSLEVDPQKCITETPDGSLHQEWWITSSGSIINAATNMCMEVYWGNFTEGNFLRLYPDNGTPAQKFVLQKRRKYAKDV